MKHFKTIIIGLLVMFGINQMNAQTVNGKKLSEIDSHYLKLMADRKTPFSMNVTVRVDYGQSKEDRGLNKLEIRDDEDKIINFTSIVDALNFFFKNGYELKQTYLIKNVHHYLLVRIK